MLAQASHSKIFFLGHFSSFEHNKKSSEKVFKVSTVNLLYFRKKNLRFFKHEAVKSEFAKICFSRNAEAILRVARVSHCQQLKRINGTG